MGEFVHTPLGSILFLFVCLAVPFVISYLLPYRRIFRSGLISLRKKDHVKAIEWFSKCVEKKPTSYEALLNRAIALSDLGRFDEALLDCENAIRISSENSSCYHIKGDVYYKMKKYKIAIENLSKALSLKPSLSEMIRILLVRGVMFHREGELKAADNDFKEAVRISRNNADVCNCLGYFYLVTGRFAEALVNLNKAIKFNPKFAFAYNNRAFALANLNRLEEAFEDFRRSEELDNSNAFLYKFRGLSYKMMGKNNEACDDLQRALKMNPGFDEELSPIIREIRDKL